MQIDVRINDVIKMKSYRTPMKNRAGINKAIDEMLDADVTTLVISCSYLR